ncbi:hypothetical protein IH981_01865 [Patescibacteria group bacterium]|nr:hypothetical protein [Patescibacteria group bacterium]
MFGSERSVDLIQRENEESIQAGGVEEKRERWFCNEDEAVNAGWCRSKI